MVSAQRDQEIVQWILVKFSKRIKIEKLLTQNGFWKNASKFTYLSYSSSHSCLLLFLTTYSSLTHCKPESSFPPPSPHFHLLLALSLEDSTFSSEIHSFLLLSQDRAKFRTWTIKIRFYPSSIWCFSFQFILSLRKMHLSKALIRLVSLQNFLNWPGIEDSNDFLSGHPQSINAHIPTIQRPYLFYKLPFTSGSHQAHTFLYSNSS
jgi:hypothetical protein